MSGPPREVVDLAEARAAARAAGDYAAADELRARLARLGWTVTDTAAGPRLDPAGVHAVADVSGMPDRSALPGAGRATVSVIVDGWAEEAAECLAAVLRHAPGDVGLQVLNRDESVPARAALEAIAAAAPGRVELWHLGAPAGWGELRRAALRADTSPVHIWCEPSTIFDGDAVSPLLAALADPQVAAAGWRGVNVAGDWTQFHPAPAGQVDALLGYLLAVRRDAALAVGGPDPRARFYRNADLEFCFALREAGLGRLLAVDVPCRQGRHHGYHDADPGYRDRESRRNYRRFLDRFRGRMDLLAPRG